MLLCLQCRWEGDPPDDADACPNCGSHHVPADLANEVDIKITWHELRVLVMWAENWASVDRGPENEEKRQESRRSVYTIADRIQAQHLDHQSSLTMVGEMRQLRDAFGQDNVEVHGVDESSPPPVG